MAWDCMIDSAASGVLVMCDEGYSVQKYGLDGTVIQDGMACSNDLEDFEYSMHSRVSWRFESHLY